MLRVTIIITLLVALVILLTPGAVAAGDVVTLVYPLSDVIGDYPVIGDNTDPLFSRSQTITYEGPRATVVAMRVIISGTAEAALVGCEGAPEPDVVGMDVGHTIRRTDVYERWWGFDIADGGPFAMTNSLQSTPPSFDTLHDGDTFEFTQSLSPLGLVGLCWFIEPLPWQEGSIDAATLEIDVTYPLAVDPATWSRIKALYR